MNKSIQKYIVDNISTILKILSIYVIGILIGVILFNFTQIKTEYTSIIKSIFDKTQQENFENVNIIANGIKNNIIYILILYSTTLTIIAPFLVCMCMNLKAIVTGIYICTIFSLFGIVKGILVTFLSVFIPLILTLIGYLIICTNVINIFRQVHNGSGIDIKLIVKQIYWGIISFSLISFSLVVEQLLTSVIFHMYGNVQ